MLQVEYKAKDEVCEQMVADLICTAFEGGIGHWASVDSYKKPEKVFKWDLVGTIGGAVYKYVQYPMSEGGAVMLSDSQGETDDIWTLDLPSIKKGLVVMATKYPKHYRNFLKEQSDAETGDVFIQCCIFGELVYG
jgi:hypothetical protein